MILLACNPFAYLCVGIPFLPFSAYMCVLPAGLIKAPNLVEPRWLFLTYLIPNTIRRDDTQRIS